LSGVQHGPVFLDELMKLEILHLLPVRGYGTIFSAIGVKAWVHGQFIEWPGHQNAAPLPRRDSAPL